MLWFIALAHAQEAELLSVNAAGTGPGNGPSHGPAVVSRDGRYVAFASEASDLVEGDDNGYMDVFFRDREAGTTVRITERSRENASGVCFRYADGTWVGNVDMTEDGSQVFFTSSSADIHTTDDDVREDYTTVFRWFRDTGVIEPISYVEYPNSTAVEDRGCWPTVSADGSEAAFVSDAIEAYDPTFEESNVDGDLFSWDLGGFNALSHLEGDTDAAPAVGSVVEGNPIHLSGDGSWVVYEHGNRDGVDHLNAWLYDRLLFSHRPIGGPDSFSVQPSIDFDGRTLAFATGEDLDDSGEGGGDLDVFLEDRLTGEVTRVTPWTPDQIGDSERPHLSDDGDVVVFQSEVDLVGPSDRTAAYAWHVSTGEMVLLSVDEEGAPATGTFPNVSGDGQWVTYKAGSQLYIVPSTGPDDLPGGDTGDTGGIPDTGEVGYVDPGTPDGLANLSVELGPAVGTEAGWEIGLDLRNPDSSDPVEDLVLDITAEIFDSADAVDLTLADTGDLDCERSGTTATCTLPVIPFDGNQTITLSFLDRLKQRERERQDTLRLHIDLSWGTSNDPYPADNWLTRDYELDNDALRRSCFGGCGGGQSVVFGLPLLLLALRRRRGHDS